ncbi:MAG: triphosphoribosyl-dephospho-CoA synthase [Planctomycetia bacterium]|nr:triphosphoribosyl-dephospho-CoA synthase [Planctomycetia bacterium]
MLDPTAEFVAFCRRIPASCPPWGRGWCAAVACMLEASAPKPGNVYPGADFHDLSCAELFAAGLAISPVLERAAALPLGRVILQAVQASRNVTRSNANLGIVLVIAPLAAVSDAPLAEHDRVGFGNSQSLSPERAAAVLARLRPTDAADVWQAIACARPGGMGSAKSHDLTGPPPGELLEAMHLAASHDQIAKLWSHGYHDLFTGPVNDLAGEIELRADSLLADSAPLAALSEAIVRCYLRQLARQPDSLIARKHGDLVAAEVSLRAARLGAIAEQHSFQSPAFVVAMTDFDTYLRSPLRLNPGTTADLIAASLYILLRGGQLRPLLSPLFT